MSFPKWVRKAIGQRDSWTCQVQGCGRSFQTGWMVEADHVSSKQQGGGDSMDNGQILCLRHHAAKHFDDGEISAGDAILERMERNGERTQWWYEKYGWK